MACTQNMPQGNDSEMEEGEIVDDLDDLSEISSEEEFLLRQRLQVLENYNNVLERKKAKDMSFGSGKHKEDYFLHNLSDISATDFDENLSHVSTEAHITVYRGVKGPKHKSNHKQKKKKEIEPQSVGRSKEHKKKLQRKKRLGAKIISESSEESDDEYRLKRRKLADAVIVHKDKNDKSSLHDRLQKMLCGTKPPETQKTVAIEDKQTEANITPNIKDITGSPKILETNYETTSVNETDITKEVKQGPNTFDLIDLCTDDDTSIDIQASKDTVDAITTEKNDDGIEKGLERDSDEDLELLRQLALKTKTLKSKPDQETEASETVKTLQLLEDEDSDTAELRLICLKSALLKKAIEMKQKQKLRKRLSHSSTLQNDFFDKRNELLDEIASENNTDIESVDMDMGSDADEKEKENANENSKVNAVEQIEKDCNEGVKNTQKTGTLKEDELLEEDEDLLRAKLLTSLSKNLPNLVDPSIINSIDEESKTTTKLEKENKTPAIQTKLPAKRIIINLGESDSEAEHEATKNLTKMHIKLSEQIDFQQKLDMFLKTARMEVENEKPPDVVQNPQLKTPEKFVAKTVNHLPKTEQIEYKNLVKRMKELQKIKEARQVSMNILNKEQVKDTLKPKNASVVPTQLIDADKLEVQISLSRKRIAVESAKMMKLKEEGVKLSQKYKIVATELKNIATAINLNKKEQRAAQNRLTKIRNQHQRLFNSSNNIHSKSNGNLLLSNTNRVLLATKLQKENNPTKDDHGHIQKVQKPIIEYEKLSVEVDVRNNKKKVAMPNAETCGSTVSTQNDSHCNINGKCSDESLPPDNIMRDTKNDRVISAIEHKIERRKEFHDYESPLQALVDANWEADPNAIMCPFEVGGFCKDHDCKYLHPKLPSQ